MIEKARMREMAVPYGIMLDDEQLSKLDAYAETLVDWNSRMNLTAITEPEEMEHKHFLDSLLFAAQPEVKGSVVDVGSGAGFPGVVAKLYKPGIELTLMEPTGKRITFLQHLLQTLGLQADTVKERAEEAARKQWREKFEVATARAVAALPALCEYCLPLVKPGGWFIAMKGEAAGEVQQAQTALAKLGGEYVKTLEFILPDGAARSLVFIRKTGETPDVYPRNGGKIAKAPLGQVK